MSFAYTRSDFFTFDVIYSGKNTGEYALSQQILVDLCISLSFFF